MLVRKHRVRSTQTSAIWAGALLALALLSLGLVHHQSGRSARAKIVAQPLRPLLLVDLVANREARGGKPLAELETWRAAVAAFGREVEVFEGESLIDVDPARYAVWVLPAQDRLSDYDWDALDSYLAPRRRSGADGRHGALERGRARALGARAPVSRRALRRLGERRQELARGGPQPAGRRLRGGSGARLRQARGRDRNGHARRAGLARRGRGRGRAAGATPRRAGRVARLLDRAARAD